MKSFLNVGEGEIRLPFSVCRLTGYRAHVAQSVEHVLGKDEVTGSNPVVGSKKSRGISIC